MFTEDGGVLHFNTPKVQAAVGANTYAARRSRLFRVGLEHSAPEAFSKGNAQCGWRRCFSAIPLPWVKRSWVLKPVVDNDHPRRAATSAPC